MRAFALGLIFSAAAFPCLAQTVLKSEPLILAPYEVAFVQDSSCGTGKVLKVTGAIRGLQRRKACVTLASEQASLVIGDAVERDLSASDVVPGERDPAEIAVGSPDRPPSPS